MGSVSVCGHVWGVCVCGGGCLCMIVCNCVFVCGGYMWGVCMFVCGVFVCVVVCILLNTHVLSTPFWAKCNLR